jgi:hypothetical protein
MLDGPRALWAFQRMSKDVSCHGKWKLSVLMSTSTVAGSTSTWQQESRAPRRGREATIKTLHCSKFKCREYLEYLYVATRGT